MRYFLPVVVLSLAFFSSTAQNDFRSRQSGDWADPETWEEFNGSSWQNTSNVPDETAGSITVESFMTITITTALSANQVIVLEDGLIDIQSGGFLTLIDDTGTELDIAIGDGSTTFDGNVAIRSGGTLENQGEVSSDAGNLAVSGRFIHNRNGGAIPPAGWASGSALIIRGVTNQAPSGFGIALHSLEWDCSSQSSTVFLDGPILDIGDNFTITNTNDQRLFLNDDQTMNLQIGGDFMIGNFCDVVMVNSGSTTLDVAGHVTNFGILRMAIGGGSAALNAEKDFNSPGDLFGSGNLSFTGTTLQLVSVTGGTSGNINYIIPDDAEADLTTSVLGGSGTLTVGNDVVLYTAMADTGGAFQNNTTGGSIRLDPANRTYGDNLELIFNGTAQQFTGDAMPDGGNFMLTNSNAAGVVLTGDFNASGDIKLSTGSLLLNGNKLTIQQDIISGTGYHIIPDENASLEILGSGNFGNLPLPAGSNLLGSLVIDRSGGAASVRLTSNLAITGDLTLADGTLELQNYTLELRKDILTTSGQIETTSGSGIHISGSGPLAPIPFRNVNNDLGSFIYERSGTTFIGTDNLMIHDELGLYDGNIDNSGDFLALADGSLILRKEGELTGNAPVLSSGIYHLSYEGGSKTAGLELLTGPDELADLTVKDGPVTIDRNFVVNGEVLLQDGSLLVENADMTMRGAAWTNNSGDFIQENGVFYVENILSIDGTGSEQFDDVEIDNAYSLAIEYMSLGGDLNILTGGILSLTGELLINGQGDQQINGQSTILPAVTINKPSGEVFINEPLMLDGTVRFESATTGHADGNLVLLADPADRFGGGRIDVLPAGASISGDVITEWHQENTSPTGIPMYFGSTVSDENISGLQDDILVTGGFSGADSGPVNPSLFLFDEPVAGTIDNGWVAYPTTDDQAPLEQGRGYLAYVMDNAPVTLDISGVLNQGDISVPLTFTDSGTPVSDGWNLVANPFASAIGWDQLNGWDKSSVRGVIAVYREGKFQYYNNSGAGQGTILVMENGLVAKHEAFWVQATATGNLVIGEQAKAEASDITPPASPANQMLLTLSDGSDSDQALLVVAPGATSGYDAGMDAPKFDNYGMDIATLAADDTPLAMNFLAPLGCGESISVQVSDVESGNYTLSVNTIAAFDLPYLVTLYDAFLDITHNVNNNPNYSFTIDKNTSETYAGRFTLMFEADLDDLVNKNLSYLADGTICPGSTGTVTFSSTQSGVSYQLEVNGRIYGNPQTGTGSTLFFDLDPNDLEATNTIKVLASPASCATPVYLTEEKTVVKSDLEPEILYAGGKLVSNYVSGNTWYLGDLSQQLSTSNEIVPSGDGTYILVVNNGTCSASISYDFVVTDVEADLDKDITVYPNPVTGNHVNVFLDQWNGQEVLVEVMSLNGHVLETTATQTGNLRLDVSRYARGVYLLRLYMGDKVQTTRFIRK